MEALTSDVENVSTQDLNNTEGWESSKSIIDSLLLRFHIEFNMCNSKVTFTYQLKHRFS